MRVLAVPALCASHGLLPLQLHSVALDRARELYEKNAAFLPSIVECVSVHACVQDFALDNRDFAS